MTRAPATTRAQKKPRMTVGLLAAAFTATSLISTPPAAATFPGENGRIFFRQGKNIYSVSSVDDGTSRTLVAKGNDYPGDPKLLDVSVSPNGKRIAFSAAGNIWIKTVGGASKNVTKRASDNVGFTQARYPAWSPDGDQLVFQATRRMNGYPRNRLYRVNVDGSGIKHLHLFDTNLSYHGFPDWSVNDEIVFVVLDDLWVMNPDGGAKHALTTDGANYREPSWSPDGTKIAVTSEAGTTIHAPNPGVVILDGTTGNVLTHVTGPADYETEYSSPSWSPEANFVAFSGYVSDSTSPIRGILKAPAANGSAASVTNVYQGSTHSWEPAWGTAVP